MSTYVKYTNSQSFMPNFIRIPHIKNKIKLIHKEAFLQHSKQFYIN